VSLRARLLAGMVVLVTAGLAAAAIVTYEEQRSFLYSRVDQEVHQALGPVSFILVRRDGRGAAVFAPAHHLYRPLRARPLVSASGIARRALESIPPGSFGELIGRDGRVIGTPVQFRYGSGRPPVVPVALARASAPRQRLFEFAGYRAIAVPVPDGTEIAAVSLHDTDATLGRLVLVEGLVGAGVLVALVVLGWLMIRFGLRPLERIQRTASEIAHGDFSRRIAPVDERTEVGRLALSLNEMLAQIERAFDARTISEERLRQFLADASHELRTPLSAIRGYAELQRLGALEEPGETERAMERIEAEASRMGELVEDLLTLAHLDELPAPKSAPVDLGELAERALEEARALAPDTTLKLRCEGDDGAYTVSGDAEGLHRVLSNLLRNAIVHTPPATPVEVRLARAPDRISLEVRDHGPGLPVGAEQHAFERFWRAQGGRRRGPGGSGLGLAIVKAIVEAHHGQVHAERAPGGGALFRVTLPVDARFSGNAQRTPSPSTLARDTLGA
jgi:two-component system OmpR family sensor kinase